MKGEKVGKRKTKREKVKKALPALPLNGSLGGGFLSSEWAVAHTRSGCDCGQGSGDSGHDDLQDDFPDVVLFHHIIYNLTIYNLLFIYNLAIWLFFPPSLGGS